MKSTLSLSSIWVMASWRMHAQYSTVHTVVLFA